MYKCLDCGHVFANPKSWEEDRGEYWGVRCSESVEGCPRCKGDFEEAHECEICGSSFTDDELHGGVCKECIDSYKNDFDMCYEISLGHTESVEINSLLASLFEPDEINTILKNHIKQNCPNIDCGSFIYADEYFFGEMLSKEVNK